jgi:hypothetical protein
MIKLKKKLKKPSLPKLTQLTSNLRYEIEITQQKKKQNKLKIQGPISQC